jgi:hypothetical protein
MKLEGSLDAFSLPDVFQLLSFTKKTGGLHLAHDGSDGVVFFATGLVTGASADSSRQPLARRIVGSGAVSDEALSAAVEAVANGEGLGVVRALRESGAVDAELLRQAAQDQATDAIFDLLRWQNGDFAFVMDEANPDDVGVTVTVETVLADAEARQASWDSVSQVVPSPQTVLVMPVVLTAEPAVSREEWSLLALVDGRRSVAELVDLTGSGQYAVVSTLAALVQRGLLAVREDAGAEQDHVAVVLRRQQLLAPLEAFTPVVVPVQSAASVVDAAEQPDVRPEAAAADETPDAEPVHEAPATTEGHDDAGHGAGHDAGHRDGGEHDAPEVEHDVAPHGDGSADDRADHGFGEDERELVSASAGSEGPQMLGGAHVPQDVVPPRPEPFLPRRTAEFDESAGVPATRSTSPVVTAGGGSPSVGASSLGDVVGATATAPDPATASVIERDPNVNRSLMLRLIAGVRGL